MAFLNLFRLIGSGIDRPADRSISEIENRTSYISSLQMDGRTYWQSHEIGYCPSSIVWYMEARQGKDEKPPLDLVAESESNGPA
jgi:hypothetical protein